MIKVTKVTNFAADISWETGSSKERVYLMQAERDQLHSERAKLKVAAVGREDREAAWSNQLQVLQEELADLSKERTRLQAENRNLRSQSSSLLAQIRILGPGHSELEMKARRAASSEKAGKDELNQLLADQARLQRLNDQLQALAFAFAGKIPRETGRSEEREASLQAERDQLSSEQAKLKAAAVGREDREAALSNQVRVLQEELADLSKESACLQISTLHVDHSKLEVGARRAATSKKAGNDELNQLLANQARLQGLQDQLQADYEELARERKELMVSERGEER